MDALQYPEIEIVSYDWLEDTLLEQRRLSVDKYRLEYWERYLTFKARVRQEIKRRSLTEADLSRPSASNTSSNGSTLICDPVDVFEEGNQAAKIDMRSDDYYFYMDDAGFIYDLELFRDDVLSGNRHLINLRVSISLRKEVLIVSSHRNRFTGLLGSHSAWWLQPVGPTLQDLEQSLSTCVSPTGITFRKH